MTIQRTSYLTDITFADHYARAGVFRGGLPAGFMACALFRFTEPFSGDGQPTFVQVIGNWTPVTEAPDTARGWQILFQSQALDDADLVLRFADGTGAVQTQFGAVGPVIETTLASDTILLHWFFGAPFLGVPNQSTLYLNGNLITFGAVGGDGNYTPPDATDLFRVGAGADNVSSNELDGESLGISGFAFTDGVAGLDIAEQSAIVAEHMNAVQLAEDVVGTGLPDGSSFFSVKHGLSQPQDEWAARDGGVILQRTGADAMRTFASRPRFVDEPWSL